jgi:hypothetical protein
LGLACGPGEGGVAQQVTDGTEGHQSLADQSREDLPWTHESTHVCEPYLRAWPVQHQSCSCGSILKWIPKWE